MDGQSGNRGRENRRSDLRNVTIRDVHARIDNVEVDRDREVFFSDGDSVGSLFLCEKRDERVLLLSDCFGGKVTATGATDCPRLEAI